MTFGNGAVETFTANNRLQPSEVTLQTNSSVLTQKVVDKQYCYGVSGSNCNAQGPGKNNGNIWAIADLLRSGSTQTFGYDNLNRLTNFTVSDQSSLQTYGYDSFGNMNQGSPGTLQSNVSFNANNQIASTGFVYDGAGNLTQANVGAGIYQTMAYNAESKLTNYNNGAATYTYDPVGTRTRKDAGSNWTEYISFGGQILAEKIYDSTQPLASSMTTWSDYIYANGQWIARADQFDARLHSSGVCKSGGCIETWQIPASGNNHVVQAGDMLMWRQYQAGGAQGGLNVTFQDGSQTAWNLNDTTGVNANIMTTQNQWVSRAADLSTALGNPGTSNLNKVVAGFYLMTNNTTPANTQWDIWYSDIAIVSRDGTVTPVYARQRAGALPHSYDYNGQSGSATAEIINSGGDALLGQLNTTYYQGDHLGSARVLTAGGGWPTTSDTFYPFGPEPSGTASPNHYQYASLERDGESGFDHADFRQLSLSQGRWLSPDPYAGSYDLGNPQSFNRYAYVLNNPMIYIDPDGLNLAYCVNHLVYHRTQH